MHTTIPVLILTLLSASLNAACKAEAHSQENRLEEPRKIVVTNCVADDVVITRTYVSQIRSRRHIEIRALDSGYLQQVNVQEGQPVKRGQVMFKILPVLYQAKLDTEAAEAEVAQIKYNNTKLLGDKSVVSDQEVALAKAELARARARLELARAELNFTGVRAPFDGIVDRQHHQQGSLISEGDILSTLSDNQVMWVYFNVPEASYLEYKTNNDLDTLKIELKLANGQVFPYPGKIGAIEAEFNNETGNIAFRADFPNPDGLLRHGQTGTILIHKKLQNAIVIPQRATFEILANKYVFVVEPEGAQGAQQPVGYGQGPAAGHGDKGERSAKATGPGHPPVVGHGGGHGTEATRRLGVVHQRQIFIEEEVDDIFVIKSGIGVEDRIIFEGVRQVRDGDRVEYEFRPPEEILANLKDHAE